MEFRNLEAGAQTAAGNAGEGFVPASAQYAPDPVDEALRLPGGWN